MENIKDYDMSLDPSLIGAAVRTHLVKLQNLFGFFNEIHDRALLELDKNKIILDVVTEKVALAIANKSTIPGSRLKERLNVEVVLEGGVVWTLAKIKIEVAESRFRHSEAKSKLSELKSAIDVARSALVWDRHELSIL